MKVLLRGKLISIILVENEQTHCVALLRNKRVPRLMFKNVTLNITQSEMLSSLVLSDVIQSEGIKSQTSLVPVAIPPT